MGAAIGSVATLGTAYITGAAQDRLHERQWLRQVRREAYGAFLNATMERFEAGEAAAKAVAQNRHDDSREHVHQARTRAAAMRRAAAIVAVEGPPRSVMPRYGSATGLIAGCWTSGNGSRLARPKLVMRDMRPSPPLGRPCARRSTPSRTRPARRSARAGVHAADEW